MRGRTLDRSVARGALGVVVAFALSVPTSAWATCLQQCEAKLMGDGCQEKSAVESGQAIWFWVKCQTCCSAPGGPLQCDKLDPYTLSYKVTQPDGSNVGGFVSPSAIGCPGKDGVAIAFIPQDGKALPPGSYQLVQGGMILVEFDVTPSSLPDAGSTDAGSTDAGSTDAGSTDVDSTDVGSTDAGGADIAGSDGGEDGSSGDTAGGDSGGGDAAVTDVAADAGVDAGGTDAALVDTAADNGGDSGNDGASSPLDVAGDGGPTGGGAKTATRAAGCGAAGGPAPARPWLALALAAALALGVARRRSGAASS